MNSMDCPTCDQRMSFVPANQDWWCNPCLASADGPAPSGLAGPTADQLADAKHQTSHSSIKASSDRSEIWFDFAELAIIAPLALLIAGGLLIYFGSWVIGAILIACVVVAGFLFG